MQAIYLDNNATTRLDPVVLDAMMPFLSEHYGNPSSIHGFGEPVRKAIEQARTQVAALLGAEHASEIVFTSCATEANSTAILSAVEALPDRKSIITSVVEHPAILLLQEKNGEIAVIRFVQRYRSSNFQSDTRKLFYLKKGQSGWQIFGESRM